MKMTEDSVTDQTAPQGLVDIWTDASLSNSSGSASAKIGGAYVVDYGNQHLDVKAFSMSSGSGNNPLPPGVEIKNITSAELGAALVALANAKPGSVRELTTDCKFVETVLRGAAIGEIKTKKLAPSMRAWALEIMAQHPKITVRWDSRSKSDNSVLADKFARLAARNEADKVVSTAGRIRESITQSFDFDLLPAIA